MNYKNVLDFFDSKKSDKPAKVSPNLSELPDAPSFGQFLQEEVVYSMIAGTVFGLGHFCGIRLASLVLEQAK